MPDAQDDDMTGRPAGTGAGTIGPPTGGATQKYFLSLLTPVRDEESYLIEFINGGDQFVRLKIGNSNRDVRLRRRRAFARN